MTSRLVDRDPDRVPGAPPGYRSAGSFRPGSCDRCGATVNVNDPAAKNDHERFHQALRAMWATAQQPTMSGAGSRAAPSVETAADASPVPATSPPTPEQEEAAGLARPGVGGSNHQHNRPPAASEGPHSPDGTTPPDPAPPPRGRSGGPKRGRPMRSVDEIEEADRREYEQRHAAEGRR